MYVAYAITNRTAKDNAIGELLDDNLARPLRPDMEVASASLRAGYEEPVLFRVC